MRSIPPWLLMLSVLLAATAPASRVAAGPHDDEQMAALEQQIDQARKQLDDAARKLAELHSTMWQLETSGPRAERPMLGILIDDSGTEQGLTLVGVTPEGGAERAGLKAGDCLVEVNGVRLDDSAGKKPMYLLSEAMSDVRAGEPVPVRYLRDGKTREARVETRARGAYMAQVLEEKRPWLESLQSLAELEDLEALEGLQELEILEGGKLDLSGEVMRVPAGLRLEDVSGELARYFEVDQGVLVLHTRDDTGGLRAGDILLTIDGDAVSASDTALERLATLNGEVAASVKRRGREQQVTLDADALNAQQAVQVMRGDRRIRIQRLGDGDQVRLEISVDE